VDAYKEAPFKVMYSNNHVQPLNVKFNITFSKDGGYRITSEGKEVYFYNFGRDEYKNLKENWSVDRFGKVGKLLQTEDFSFIIAVDSNRMITDEEASMYSFTFSDLKSLTNMYKNGIDYSIVDKKATVIKISTYTQSISRGLDIINELMRVYSEQNLQRKNHIASITIDYIEKQLGEISDSLNIAEDNLQQFRSSNRLLDVSQQAGDISQQYMSLQNQRAEMVTRKRYYDYVASYLHDNDDFSNITVPASMGISDPMLNNLMTELVMAQSQKANLISNKQDKNPLVKKLDIQIDNLKKTVVENIGTVRQTTEISLDEMNKRLARVEGQISTMPRTERLLGGIERKYRLNDAIYNYLLEKRAEAKITKASNLPDDVILEQALVSGEVSPNKKKNYMLAFILGLGLPFGFLVLKKALNNKIESQDSIEKLTKYPVLGKVPHNYKRTNNAVYDFPLSTIAESYRTLRTNIDFFAKGSNHNKIIMVTSCIQGEGKSFSALNLAMSYAQLGRKTILVDFDLRKKSTFFNNGEDTQLGLSTFLNKRASLHEIIRSTPHEKLHLISSGPVPHNPAELLALDETDTLLKSLRTKYDVVIVDTPPLAQVTDGYLIIESADIVLVVARYNYTKKDVLSIVVKDLRQKNTQNVCLLLNDNKYNRDQYGYGYGYNKKHK
jgi:capsular exopolysaccharide synthesis family protein